MDSSIHRIVPRARLAARRASNRHRRPEREFLLPSEEGEEGEVVLEPQPRRERGEFTVSRARLADEAGQNLDIRG